ncbi:hypothetical protein Acr_00g0104360 [Actinidia rufa]|uniref:Uncharacterized protein n=1 Tax=Actinidia rufa TaxID=165716 RepID=A0A7J0E0Z4_9ERIC|nr:hypothetical protein Acr_00g0104360 [Actinidia rufa]
MLDRLYNEDGTEEIGQSAGKKRRLSFDQVKALEKAFKVDNKLEAEQKLKHLRSKPGEENTETNHSAKEDFPKLEAKNNVSVQNEFSFTATNQDFEVQNNGSSSETKSHVGFRDGFEKSNCSEVFLESDPSSCVYSTWMNHYFPYLASSGVQGHPHQLVKMEEQNMFCGEDSFSIFSVDQAPTFHWQH